MQAEPASEQALLLNRIRNLTARRLRAIARNDWQLVGELGALRHNCLQLLDTADTGYRSLCRSAA